MGQKYKRFREFRTSLSMRDIRKNPRSMYARVPQAMVQFLLKIEKLSHIMGPAPIIEMARAYGLRPRLWLLPAYFCSAWLSAAILNNYTEITTAGHKKIRFKPHEVKFRSV